ncbi:MAG TPA: hypothetical protein VK427_14635, partial [Kofleriaceae bacterium]|nr:hypothetical protein [Kofleriaceae bacterium]
MTRGADLEAVVREAWTGSVRDEVRALLAVYADELQEQDDPRGELIALDLLRTPTTDDHVRKAELMRAWLGPIAKHPNITTRFGLLGVAISDTDPNLLDEVLASAAAPFVASVSAFAFPHVLRVVAGALADAPRPWLGSLRLASPIELDDATFEDPVIEDALAAELVAATPVLRILEVSGRAMMRELAHPALHRVVASSEQDLGALVGAGAPLGVAELAVGLGSMPALPASHLPALRHLDLARST